MNGRHAYLISGFEGSDFTVEVTFGGPAYSVGPRKGWSEADACTLVDRLEREGFVPFIAQGDGSLRFEVSERRGLPAGALKRDWVVYWNGDTFVCVALWGAFPARVWGEGVSPPKALESALSALSKAVA